MPISAWSATAGPRPCARPISACPALAGWKADGAKAHQRRLTGRIASTIDTGQAWNAGSCADASVDHEDRQVRSLEHVLSEAPEDRLPQAAMAIGAHDHEVCL